MGRSLALIAVVAWAVAQVALAAPPRPAACRSVAAGASLQPLLDALPEGAALCLEPGRYQGPVRLQRRATLWGPREAVIRSRGQGSTVSLEAQGAALLGLSVDGSGGRFDLLDAAVRISADDAHVEGVAVRGALFGILAERARGLRIRDNEVFGDPEKPLGLRGDAIRVWEVRHSEISGNRLRDGRDLVIWYSPTNRIADNQVTGGRYGTHFMYSHGNRVEGNRYVENVVGIFAMYSRELVIRDNLVARSAGAAGVGLGAKESEDLRVTGNRFLGNRVGIYLDNSPLQLDRSNHFERNVLRHGEVGVVFHGGAARNRFEANEFRDNRVPVRVEGRGDAQQAEWRGNYWGSYAGYDLDGDGRGDIPYQLRSLSDELTARQPALAFFRGSPAMALIELVGRAVPLFQPRTLLVDPQPRMQPEAAGGPRAG